MDNTNVLNKRESTQRKLIMDLQLTDQILLEVIEMDGALFGMDGLVEIEDYYSVIDGNKYYVGDLDLTLRLINKFNLVDLQPAILESALVDIDGKQIYNEFGTTATIGFNIKEQKWYGWGCDDIKSFGIGSTCVYGDIAYISKTQRGLYNSLTEEDEFGFVSFIKKDVELMDNGLVRVKIGYIVEVDKGMVDNYIYFAPGRGEWTVNTVEEAKILASNYAYAIS